MFRQVITSRVCILILGAAACASAGTISYTGTLSDPNAVYLNTFTVVATADITLQSYGYGGTASAPGGTNAAASVIGSGGFDPVLAVFGPDGTFIDQNDDGNCPPGALDAGNCFDSTLQFFSLSAGTYTFALTVAGNYAAGAHLSDGFTGGGDFFDRTNAFAADVTVDPVSQVPEPQGAVLFSVGILVICARLIGGRRLSPSPEAGRVNNGE
jgi:hypothetical protein